MDPTLVLERDGLCINEYERLYIDILSRVTDHDSGEPIAIVERKVSQ